MTVWGAWSYSSGNGVRLGADWSYAGQTLNVTITANTQYNYSGDTFGMAWSGSWSGSQGVGIGSLSQSSGSYAVVWSGSFGPQAYNSTASLTITMSGLYSGSTPSVGFTSYLGPLAPAAPTFGTATRISDSQINLTWTNNPTASAPCDTNYVARFDNTVPASVVGVLAGTVASFPDTGLVADREFQYQVSTSNAAGYAYSSLSAFVYTTPADPSSCAAAKNAGGDIVVTWTNTSTYAAKTPVEVWHAANGVWDGAALFTTAAGATSYTHTAPSTAVTHTYRVRAVSPTGGLVSGYSVSNVVILLARPNAPTGLTLASTIQNGSTVDASVATTLGWAHNPVDSSAQSAYEVQYQVSSDGGATWGGLTSTGKITSATASKVYAGATWAQNRVVRWQVRTWGAYAGTAPTYSDWSAFSTLYTSTRPVAVITSGAAFASSSMAVTGTFYDAEGGAQAGARWTLRTSGGVQVETVTLGASQSSQFLAYTFTTTVLDGTAYVVAYQVQDATGLWSAEATQNVTVTYAKPPTPTLVLTWSDVTGSVTGVITNPAGSPAVDHNVILRDGVALPGLSSIPVNGTFVDNLPKLGAAMVYSVIAVSALPSSSLVGSASVTPTSTSAYLNGGMGLGTVCRLDKLPKASLSAALEKTSKAYEGRTRPTAYSGILVTRTGKITGMATDAEYQALEALVLRKEVGCFRDPYGRKLFLSLTSIDVALGAGNAVLVPYVISVEEVESVE